MLAGSAHADPRRRSRRCRCRRRAGIETISQPLTFARIHEYLSMATPLLWTRQADTIGVLGLALNACDERANGHREQTERIRELLLTARDLWRTFPELEDEGDRVAHGPARVPAAPPREHHGGDRRLPELTVNGHAYSHDAPVGRSLAEVLREDLGLTGTKIACGEGHCGACTVQLDGVPVLSCITLVAHRRRARGDDDRGPARAPARRSRSSARTRSSAASARRGRSSRRRRSSPANPEPTREEIRHGMAGNLCRCGTYPTIEEAIRTWRD